MKIDIYGQKSFKALARGQTIFQIYKMQFSEILSFWGACTKKLFVVVINSVLH
jgi:hypothetical protein